MCTSSASSLWIMIIDIFEAMSFKKRISKKIDAKEITPDTCIKNTPCTPQPLPPPALYIGESSLKF